MTLLVLLAMWLFVIASVLGFFAGASYGQVDSAEVTDTLERQRTSATAVRGEAD